MLGLMRLVRMLVVLSLRRINVDVDHLSLHLVIIVNVLIRRTGWPTIGKDRTKRFRINVGVAEVCVPGNGPEAICLHAE